MEKEKGFPKGFPFVLVLFLVVFCCLTFSGFADTWDPPPWGLDLEGLNRFLKGKPYRGRVEEDKTRAEIELQYSPLKSIKIKRGQVTAWVVSPEPGRPGMLFGYASAGKLFGQVIFFKDHPEIFPETAPRTLKERFPQGRIVRIFAADRPQSYFEYLSDTLYVFSSVRGVYFYEPKVLEKVVKIEQGILSEQEEKIENELKKMSPR